MKTVNSQREEDPLRLSFFLPTTIGCGSETEPAVTTCTASRSLVAGRGSFQRPTGLAGGSKAPRRTAPATEEWPQPGLDPAAGAGPRQPTALLLLPRIDATTHDGATTTTATTPDGYAATHSEPSLAKTRSAELISGGP